MGRKMLLFLLAIFILLRVININQPLARDEIVIRNAYQENHFPESFVGISGQPLLWLAPSALSVMIFGFHDWAFRLPPILASIITLILLFYYLCKRFGFDTAILGTAFIAVLPWHILASTQLLQASLLMLLSLICLIFTEKYVETNKWSMIVITAIFAYIAMITQFIAVVLPITIVLFLLLSSLKFKAKVKSIITFGFVYGMFLIITFWVLNLTVPDHIINLFYHTQELALGSLIPAFSISSILILFLWAGPFLLLFMFFLPRVRWKVFRKDTHLIFILVSVFVFFLLNSDYFRPFERYFMILIPSIIIFIFNYGKDLFDYVYKNRKVLFVSFFGFLALFISLGLLFDHILIPLEPKGEFIESFFLNIGRVLVPFSSNGGPVGFYVPGLVIFTGWLSMSMLFFANLFLRRKYLFLSMLSLLMAFNFTVVLFQVGIIGEVNPNKATAHLISEMQKFTISDNVTVYQNQGIAGYLHKNAFVFDHSNFKPADSVLIVNFPYLPENHFVWNVLHRCKQVFLSYRFNVKHGIYNCSNIMNY